MKIPYPGNPIEDDNNIGLTIASEYVDNVINAFKQDIPKHPNYIFLNSELIDDKERYKEYQKTHFQSVIRIRNSPYLILSGGDDDKKHSQIFIAKMQTYLENIDEAVDGLKTKLKKRAFGSNEVFNKSKLDFIIDIKTLFDGKYWHGGGMDSFGNLLITPIENMEDETSRIEFIDVRNPEKPKLLNHLSIQRGANEKASAVGITRLNNKYFVLGVWAYNGGRRRVDFYFSKTTDINNGFHNTPAKIKTVLFDQVDNNFNEYRPEYQNIFFCKTKDDKLYIIGTENATLLNPIHLLGKNRAHLFRIVLDGRTLQENNPRLEMPDMVYLGDRVFSNVAKQYNFDAGTGFYITEEHTLAMYAITHYRVGNMIKMAEFYPILKKKEIKHIDESVIELYEHKNFKGKCLRIYGGKFSKIKDYDKIKVEGKKFRNKVSSVRYVIPNGKKYRLYDDVNHRIKVIDLVGNGKLKEIWDLKKDGNGDKVSSSKFI